MYVVEFKEIPRFTSSKKLTFDRVGSKARPKKFQPNSNIDDGKIECIT